MGSLFCFCRRSCGGAAGARPGHGRRRAVSFLQVNIQTSSNLLHNGCHSISPQTQWEELQARGLDATGARVASRHGYVQKSKMLLRLQTQLREELQARSLDAAGGKPALVERLHSALASRPAAGVSAQRAGAAVDRPAAANKELLRLRERVRSFGPQRACPPPGYVRHLYAADEPVCSFCWRTTGRQ